VNRGCEGGGLGVKEGHVGVGGGQGVMCGEAGRGWWEG
jgi:hypothetical protein